MRGKRSKQYRKLMEQYCMTFGFREPYQVLLDAEMVRDSCRFKMDLEPALERTVHGKVKPMITQCEIRKLYGQGAEAATNEAIDLAKRFERRRCGHHPDEYKEPLSTEECLRSVVDPKDSGQNKHRYVVASQDQTVRRMLRGIRSVPLIYVRRSVMILEPMADESVQIRAREERSKFRAEIRNALGKRKREKDGEDDDDSDDANEKNKHSQEDPVTSKDKKKKGGRGPKGPNPLSMKKSNKKTGQNNNNNKAPRKAPSEPNGAATEAASPAKRKRRRKAKGGAEGSAPSEIPTARPQPVESEA